LRVFYERQHLQKIYAKSASYSEHKNEKHFEEPVDWMLCQFFFYLRDKINIGNKIALMSFGCGSSIFNFLNVFSLYFYPCLLYDVQTNTKKRCFL